jgi:hypothetical protein
MDLTPVDIARNNLRKATSDHRLAEIDYMLNPTLLQKELCVSLYRQTLEAQAVYNEARRRANRRVIIDETGGHDSPAATQHL